jgi:hypothetical protein
MPGLVDRNDVVGPDLCAPGIDADTGDLPCRRASPTCRTPAPVRRRPRMSPNCPRPYLRDVTEPDQQDVARTDGDPSSARACSSSPVTPRPVSSQSTATAAGQKHRATYDAVAIVADVVLLRHRADQPCVVAVPHLRVEEHAAPVHPNGSPLGGAMMSTSSAAPIPCGCRPTLWRMRRRRRAS